MSTPSLEYLALLGATLAIELLVVLRFAPRGERLTWLVACLAVNLVSHPLASHVYSEGLAGFGPIEGGVVLVEVAGYRVAKGARLREAALVSLLANGASAGIGLVMF